MKALLATMFAIAVAAQAAQPLPDGVYAVLREGPTRERALVAGVPHRVLLYDREQPGAEKKEAPRYIAIDTAAFVPLVLAGPPETKKDDRGWTLLRVRLAAEHVKTLERFTREHLDGEVATVIGGEAITLHKVRAVITDGNAVITRCTDDACQVLRMKLAR